MCKVQNMFVAGLSFNPESNHEGLYDAFIIQTIHCNGSYADCFLLRAPAGLTGPDDFIDDTDDELSGWNNVGRPPTPGEGPDN